MKDLIAAIFLIFIVVILFTLLATAGCSLYDKDRSLNSRCIAKCDTCNNLELTCDHVNIDDQLITNNHPSQPHDTSDRTTQEFNEETQK